MDDFEVLWLVEADQIAQAASVAARALQDDPDWVSISSDPRSLPVARVAGVQLGGMVRGVAAAVGPGKCVGALLPPGSRQLDPPARDAPDSERLLYFRSVLAHHDTTEPHWHVGPVGVERGFQSRGMGSAAMQLVCDEFDEHGRVGWVKTAKRENTRFYGGLGFEVVEEAPMLDAHLWFMRREPR